MLLIHRSSVIVCLFACFLAIGLSIYLFVVHFWHAFVFFFYIFLHVDF